MSGLITLSADPRTIPGVESVAFGEAELIVKFANGKRATVQRSPLSQFINREAFDVYLPEQDGFARIAPSKSPEDVIAMLEKMAAEAAGN